MLRYELIYCTEDEKYYGCVHYNDEIYFSGNDYSNTRFSTFSNCLDRTIDNRVHGPAMLMVSTDQSVLSTDRVLTYMLLMLLIRCLLWPSQATEWPTRPRNHDWPDLSTIDHVVSNGCDVVKVSHRQCRHHPWMDKLQWRLSFSRAEIVLINTWTPVQQIVYHMLRFFCEDRAANRHY